MWDLRLAWYEEQHVVIRPLPCTLTLPNVADPIHVVLKCGIRAGRTQP